MKYTIVGDLHATNKNLDKVNKLFNMVEDLNNPVIWLGDLLDTKEVIRGNCLNLVYERFKNSKLSHIVLVGNHDYFNLDCKDHSLRTLEMLPNITIVDAPTYMGGMSFIPFMHDKEQLKKTLATTRRSESSILFAHLDVVGFDYGNGSISESGIIKEDLRNFDLVISGHYHKFQNNKNLVYLGTPFSHSFGESDCDKYIAILDLEIEDKTKRLKFIKTDFPRHQTITIDCDVKLTETTRNEVPKNYDGRYLRVIFSGLKESIEAVKNSYQLPEGTKAMDKVIDDFSTKIVMDEAKDNKGKFEYWAKEIKGLSQNTINLGLEILESIHD